MGISSAGIGSGLDVASIVNQLVAAERSPTAARIDRTERQVNGQISALGSLRSAFDSLRSAVEKLSSDDTSMARKVKLPDEPHFSASADAGAAMGNYSVEVLALATANKVSTAAHADSDAAVGTGTLTISSGETTLDIEIDSGNNTLAGIRDAINKAADGKGVSASIIHADDGARLVLTATETGLANALSISASGGDGGLATMVGGTSELAAATDALVKVNGFQRSSASNSISDMLEGVTLTLTTAAPGTVQDFSIASDPSPLRGAAKDFVKAYNSALDAIAKATRYDPSTEIAAPLTGDAMVRGIGSDFRNQISAGIGDLAALGIDTDKAGKLTMDDTAFDAAIAEDPRPATRLFSGEGSLVANLETSLGRLLDDDGMFDDREAGLEGRTDGIADQRLALDRRMAQVEERYRAQFTALDVLVSKMQSTSSFLAQQLGNLPGFS